MNNNLKNFFLEKSYKISTKSEVSNTRIGVIIVCLLQYVAISALIIEPSEVNQVFLKLANVVLIFGIAVFTTSLLNKFFASMLKTFLYILVAFIYLSNLILISYTSFKNTEAPFINLVAIIFLILPIRKKRGIAAIIITALLTYLITFLLTPAPQVINVIFYISACALLYYIQVRQIQQSKYLESLQNYLISIANSGKDIYFLLDNRLQIKASNSYAIAFWGEGYLKDLVEKSIIKYISKEFRNVFINDIERVINNNVEVERELQLVDTYNQTFWVIVNLSPIKLSEQTLVSFAAKNISPIKQTESQLREALNNLAEQQENMELNQRAMVNMLEDIDIQKKIATKGEEETKTILENIADAVIVLDKHQHIKIVNKAALKLTKYKQEDLLEKAYSSKIKIIEEKKEVPYTQYLDETYKGEVVVSENKYYLLTKENEKISVSISSAPYLDKNSNVEKCIIVIKDVTRTKQIEKMKDEFVSIASHQLRTPLTTIKWHTEIMEDFKKELPKEILPSVNFISEASERLIHLVAELLDVSRIDTGRNFTIEKKGNDLVELIAKIIEGTKMLASNDEVKVNYEYNKKDSYKIPVDDFKISEAISNVVTNAIKYSKEGGNVNIKLHKDNEYAYIEITDDGLGIPKNEQSRIFERFYRAKNAMTQEGTGLGLYITKSIIEAHSGELSFVSTEGKGTTFTIKLPIK